jgi:hypothetical protein
METKSGDASAATARGSSLEGGSTKSRERVTRELGLQEPARLGMARSRLRRQGNAWTDLSTWAPAVHHRAPVGRGGGGTKEVSQALLGQLATRLLRPVRGCGRKGARRSCVAVQAALSKRKSWSRPPVERDSGGTRPRGAGSPSTTRGQAQAGRGGRGQPPGACAGGRETPPAPAPINPRSTRVGSLRRAGIRPAVPDRWRTRRCVPRPRRNRCRSCTRRNVGPRRR